MAVMAVKGHRDRGPKEEGGGSRPDPLLSVFLVSDYCQEKKKKHPFSYS